MEFNVSWMREHRVCGHSYIPPTWCARAVPDTLNGILGLTYETILLLQKTFGAKLSGELHELCKDTKNIIGKYLGEIIDFRPNKN
jgi:hypothetical protein